MTPDAIQALVARCLTDPEFLHRSREACWAPDAGGAEGMAATAIGARELERLAKFLGFITKVKHNALRKRIPSTLGLMGALGIEISFFEVFSAAYTTARRAGVLPTVAHLDLFEDELRGFLATWPDNRAGAVADTFDHERTLFALSQLESQHSCAAGALIRWRGHLRLARRRVDVVHLCATLGARRFDIARDVRLRDHILCYWLPEGVKDISVFETDALTAVLLARIDRFDTPEAMAAELATQDIGGLDANALRCFAADAEARGLVALSPAWRI
jgi:hypothetical protein